MTNSPYLFVSLKGRGCGLPMTTAGLRSLFRHHRLRSQIATANPHRFRHTFGADMVRRASPSPRFSTGWDMRRFTTPCFMYSSLPDARIAAGGCVWADSWHPPSGQTRGVGDRAGILAPDVLEPRAGRARIRVRRAGPACPRAARPTARPPRRSPTVRSRSRRAVAQEYPAAKYNEHATKG